jgi:hypothetical protein
MIYSMLYKLEDKKVGDTDVAGLINLTVSPVGQGMGRQALLFIQAIETSKIIVAFASEKDVTFFEKCGWYVGKVFGNKYLVASEPVNDSRHAGEVW